MAFLDDATLLVKKIIVTVIIYLVPVTIVVGGLLLTEKLLREPSQANQVTNSTSKTE